MDLIQSYLGDDDWNPYSPAHRIYLPSKSSAPTVADDDSNRALKCKPLDPTQRVVTFNSTYDQLWDPVYGPAHPKARDGLAQGFRSHKLGFVENASIEPFWFDEQCHTFHKYGYAADPVGNSHVGDLDAMRQNDAISVYNTPQHEQKRIKLVKNQEKKEDDDEEMATEVDNPASDTWLRRNRNSPWVTDGKKEGLHTELTDEQKRYAEEYAKKKTKKKLVEEKGETDADKSTFHGKDERDYLGRPWISPPKDAKATDAPCYIPKRLVHTWSGHTMGVSAIRFFPKHGHLILSAGMDSKVKIWDVFNSGKCMRTYLGHSKAVRDISFSSDGTKFLTAGYNKTIKFWDTETGQVISKE